MNKSAFYAALVLLLLLDVLANTRSILLGEAKVFTLTSAPPLTSQISQAFTSSGTDPLPIAGKDYTLQDTRYFDNDTWVVTTIKPLNQTVTDGMAILERQQGTYNIVLGPGTAFSSADVVNMPAKLVEYLNQTGIIYEPTFE